MSRYWGAWVVFALACSAQDSDGTRPRDVGVSRQLLLGASPLQQLGKPIRDRVPNAWPEAVACNAAKRCLAAWVQNDPAVEDDTVLLVQRFDAMGAVDQRPLPVAITGFHSVSIGVGANDEFLVTWASEAVYGRRIGADGHFIDAEPLVLFDKGPQQPATFRAQQVVQTDGTYAVFFSERVSGQDELRLVRLRDGNVLASPAHEPLVLWQGYGLNVAKGPGSQLGVVVGQAFVRVDVSDGSFLDEPFVAFAQGRESGGTAIAFDGTAYVTLWSFQNHVYANRISATDGTVAEPGIANQQLPAGHVVASGASDATNLKLFFDGQHTVAFWNFTQPGQMGVTVLDALAQRVHGGADTLWDEPFMMRTARGFALDLTSESGFLLYSIDDDQQLRGRMLTPSASGIPSAAPVVKIGTATRGQHQSTAATNGRDFLVAYRDSSTEVHLRQVDGATGVPIEPDTLSLGPQDLGYFEGLGAVWTGEVYLLTVGPSVRAVSCLELGAGEPVTFPSQPKLACNGEVCAALYADGVKLSVVRLDRRDGHALDAPQTLAESHVGWNSQMFGIAANTKPDPADRTFLVAFGDGGLRVRLLRAQDGELLGPGSVINAISSQSLLHLASDGTNFLVGSEPVATIDGLTGEMTGSLHYNSYFATEPALWHDGGSYVARRTFFDFNELVRLNPDGSLLDVWPETAADSEEVSAIESAVGTSFGRSLITESVFAPEEQSYMIRGRLLDNDLGGGLATRPLVSCAPLVPPSGGTGGEGGGGGSIGGGTSPSDESAGDGGVGASTNGGAADAGAGGVPASGGLFGGGAEAGLSGAESGAPSQPPGAAGSRPSSAAAGMSGLPGAEPELPTDNGGARQSAEPSDGGAADAGSNEGPTDDGCSCTVPHSNRATTPYWLGALVMIFRRRRAISSQRGLLLPHKHPAQ